MVACLMIQEDLSKMGVMVRHYNNKELNGYIRVTAGKPEQTDILMDCLKRLSWFIYKIVSSDQTGD